MHPKYSHTSFTAFFTITLIPLFTGLCSIGYSDVPLGERIIQQPIHRPSILLNEHILSTTRENIRQHPHYRLAFQHVVSQADAIAGTPAPKREMSGHRLLFTSRYCLKRIVYTALAYRLLEDPKYLDSAKRTMLAAADFRDWNPDHFLDTAEMTAAMAIGYDWLYHELTPEERDVIEEAIVVKGLQTVKPGMWWLKTDNNWNQVCHSGLTLGALAVRDNYPELARKTLKRTLKHIPEAMALYAPDGAYPEGPGYWKYGTTYNIFLLEALRTSLGTSGDLLKQHPAFLTSGHFSRHAVGPSNVIYSYSDCSRDEEVDPNPALYWFARETKEPGLLDHEWSILPSFIDREHNPDSRKERFLPFLLLWGPDTPPTNRAADRSWVGHGKMPVAFHRSSWDDSTAVYVAAKAGIPSSNHAHMDIGSFILDAHGLRWAEDLGKEPYSNMEKHGLKIWDRSQNSDRWKVYRHSNLSHNTLVVNGQLQKVNAHADIIKSQTTGETRFSIIDMSDTYSPFLTTARRGIRLEPDNTVVIQDHIVTREAAEIRWGMVTFADVEILHPKLARLRQKGQNMYLLLNGPDSLEWETYSTKPHFEFCRSNKGTIMVGFTYNADPAATLEWRVSFHTEKPTEFPETLPLSRWVGKRTKKEDKRGDGFHDR